MREDYAKSAVRILTNAGVWKGCGFVVPGNRVMTCAHVVAAALGQPAVARQPAPPSDPVLVHFFGSSEPHVPIRAVVYCDSRAEGGETGYGWVPLGAGYAEADMAVLEVKGTIPADIRPVPLRHLRPEPRTSFMAYGMPRSVLPIKWDDENFPGGWPTGRFTAGLANDLIGTQKDDAGDRDFILSGTSGSAAWSVDHDAVVGMVTRADEAAATAAIRPINHLCKAWPELADAREGGGLLGRGRDDTTALTFIDRSAQVRNFTKCIDSHFGKVPRVGAPLRPLFFVTQGHIDDGHEHLRTRLGIVPLGHRHTSSSIKMVGLDWEYGAGYDTSIESFSFQLMSRTNAADDTPEAIAAALNKLNQPTIIFTKLAHDYFSEAEVDALCGWVDLVDAIADQGLHVELCAFLDLCFCPRADAEGELARYAADKLPALLAAHEHRILPPFDMVRLQQLETWFGEVVNVFSTAANRKELEARRTSIITAARKRFGGKSEVRLSHFVDADCEFSLSA